MAFMQITVIPLGTGSPGVGDFITDIEQFLREKDVEHTLHDMGTILTGSVTDLLQIASDIHRLPFALGAKRVVTNISLDERIDQESEIGGKEKSILRRLRVKQS